MNIFRPRHKILPVVRKLPGLLGCLLAAFFTALPVEKLMAAEVALDVVQSTAQPGDGIDVIWQVDFTDEATLGGGMDVFWDPLVFDLVFFFPDFIGDFNWDREPDISSGLISGAAFGDFDGYSGNEEFATLFFRVRPNAPQGSSTFFVIPNSGIAGPFVSAVDNLEQTVFFVSDDVTILGFCGYTVTSPASGEAWRLNSGQVIQWETSGNDCGANVSIELHDKGGLVSTLSASTPNDGFFSWFVEGVSPGTDYYFIVTDQDDNSYNNESPNFDIIEDPDFIFSTSYE